MIVGFLIAIPYGVADLLGQPKNPLVYIFQSHFGAIAADILQVTVFLAIFSCVLANMVVATRLTFALSRDRMLPGSSVLGSVNKTTRTPIASILLVAAVGIGINMLSAGIAANVVSIASVAYYFVYLLTVGGALYAHLTKKMPGHRASDFSLGRWFITVAVSALLFTIGVVVIALAPQEGHVAGPLPSRRRGDRPALVPAVPAPPPDGPQGRHLSRDPVRRYHRPGCACRGRAAPRRLNVTTPTDSRQMRPARGMRRPTLTTARHFRRACDAGQL